MHAVGIFTMPCGDPTPEDVALFDMYARRVGMPGTVHDGRFVCVVDAHDVDSIDKMNKLEEMSMPQWHMGFFINVDHLGMPPLHDH